MLMIFLLRDLFPASETGAQTKSVLQFVVSQNRSSLFQRSFFPFPKVAPAALNWLRLKFNFELDFPTALVWSLLLLSRKSDRFAEMHCRLHPFMNIYIK